MNPLLRNLLRPVLWLTLLVPYWAWVRFLEARYRWMGQNDPEVAGALRKMRANVEELERMFGRNRGQ